MLDLSEGGGPGSHGTKSVLISWNVMRYDYYLESKKHHGPSKGFTIIRQVKPFIMATKKCKKPLRIAKRPFIGLIRSLVCLKKRRVIPLVGKNSAFAGSSSFTAGFTLIELIITLTVAGILMALAVPGMSSFILNSRLSGQANDLIADLSTARSEAIKRGVNVTVCKQNQSQTSPSCDTTTTDTWTAGRVIFVDSNGDNQVTAGETVARVRPSLDGARNTMTASANVTNLVIFTSSGLTTMTPGNRAVFLLCDQRGIQNALAVQVLATGRAAVYQRSAFSASLFPSGIPASCFTTSNWTP